MFRPVSFRFLRNDLVSILASFLILYQFIDKKTYFTVQVTSLQKYSRNRRAQQRDS